MEPFVLELLTIAAIASLLVYGLRLNRIVGTIGKIFVKKVDKKIDEVDQKIKSKENK